MNNIRYSKILIVISALACLVLLGCKAFSALDSTPTDTPIPPPTDTPIPPATDTPIPPATDTAVPTEAPTIPPTATEIPEDTPTQGPPPTVPTKTPSMSHVTFVNNLNAGLTVNLKDPRTGTRVRSVSIFARSNATFDILAGEYNYSVIASGYVPQDGSITFPPGDFTWTWGKAR